jgi:hypothetical protein
VLSVGLVKLAVLAEKTTNGLTSQALGRGPVGLLVAGRAGVRAVHTLGAAVAASAVGVGDGLDVGQAKEGASEAGRLDTSPTTKAEVVKVDGTVVRGEVRAVDLSIGE